MKTVAILMPQMGQSVAEGTIVKWRKKVGDTLAADEIVVEVESDKISFEVESPAAGRLASCLKGEGETAAVGDSIGQIEAEGEAEAPPVPPPAASGQHRPHAGGDGQQVLVSARSDGFDLERSALPDITKDWLSPYVLRLAMLNQVTIHELKSIRGSGRQGRLSKSDLLGYLARRPLGSTTVEAAATHHDSALPGDVSSLGQVVPMTAIRKTIADHMVQSIHTSAHVTMVHAVDMTRLVRLRDRIKDDFQRRYNCKMTYTAVMICVTARVLRDFPIINASVMGANIVLRKDINIGCAVALHDESLVVPVIHDADRQTFPEIAVNLDRLIKLARGKQLTRVDVEGGTFTISNFGSFGSLIGTPIINQPQVAILGMGAVYKAPVVVDDKVAVADQVYLSFTFDHRVIDGAMGGRFLNAIQRTTESLDEAALELSDLAAS